MITADFQLEVRRELLRFPEVKVIERVVPELGDAETECATAEGATEGLEDLDGAVIYGGIVGLGESGAGQVAGEVSEVDCGAAAVGAGDEGAGGGVDEAMGEAMSLAHLVVAGIFIEDVGHDGVGEEALAGIASDCGAETLGEGFAVGAVVRAAVDELLPAGAGDPPEDRYRRDDVTEAEQQLVAASEGRNLNAGLDVLIEIAGADSFA
jgi:hypothetical protein